MNHKGRPSEVSDRSGLGQPRDAGSVDSASVTREATGRAGATAQKFPIISVGGNAHERGLAYGRHARPWIELSVETYFGLFQERAGLTREKVLSLARRFGPQVADEDPEAFAEIEGIAEGSGISTDAAVALNARTELLYWNDRSRAESFEGCTTVACLPSTTADGRAFLAQSWDWLPECRDSVVMLSVTAPEGRRMITLVEAGIVARSGVNDAGIGVVANSLETERDGARDGVPVPVIRRRILASRGISQALRAVIQAKRAYSQNYLIADAAGQAISLEATPDETFAIFPESGLLTHANHFRSVAAQARYSDRALLRWPDSLYRDQRLSELLGPERGRITRAHLESAYRDHYGFPESICRHPSDERTRDSISTVAALIIDLTSRRMWAAPGPVCENVFAEYGLD